jgi:hypothetical protein
MDTTTRRTIVVVVVAVGRLEARALPNAMHRSFEPLHPSSSKLLAARWEATEYEKHRRALATVRPTVDTSAPPRPAHIQDKRKTRQLEEERLATVERDNRILLEKMGTIMRGRGMVDHINHYRDFTQRTLNTERRRRESEAVARENQRMLHTLSAAKPHYNVQKWEQDWKHKTYLTEQLTRFPAATRTGQTAAARRHSTGNMSAEQTQDHHSAGPAEKASDDEQHHDGAAASPAS